jgi:hypothetical protein
MEYVFNVKHLTTYLVPGIYIYFLFISIYVVQPKSSRNLNAARKPLVVQLWASRYRELYPL